MSSSRWQRNGLVMFISPKHLRKNLGVHNALRQVVTDFNPDENLDDEWSFFYRIFRQHAVKSQPQHISKRDQVDRLAIIWLKTLQINQSPARRSFANFRDRHFRRAMSDAASRISSEAQLEDRTHPAIRPEALEFFQFLQRARQRRNSLDRPWRDTIIGTEEEEIPVYSSATLHADCLEPGARALRLSPAVHDPSPIMSNKYYDIDFVVPRGRVAEHFKNPSPIIDQVLKRGNQRATLIRRCESASEFDKVFVGPFEPGLAAMACG